MTTTLDTGRVGINHLQEEETRIWRNLLITLFLYRAVLSVFSQLVVPEFSTLGDSGVRGQDTFLIGSRWYLDPNQVWVNVIAAFYHLLFGSKILINLGFMTLGFIGMYQVLRPLPFDLRKRMIFLMFLPSFTMWSSISNKDTIVVFAMGYLVGYLIALHFGKARLGPIHFVAVYVVFVFKTHFAPALLYAWGVILIAKHVRHKATAALVAGVGSLVPLYYFRDTVDALSFVVAPHFLDGRSTREVFWVEQYDVFWKAPYGMFQSFMGPTMNEAITSGNVLQAATYIEGIFLIAVLVYYAAGSIRKLPVYGAVFSLFSLFWILFPNYPFGILNPGSALRYRTDYVLFVFAIFAVFLSAQAYGHQKSTRPDGTQSLFGRANPRS